MEAELTTMDTNAHNPTPLKSKQNEDAEEHVKVCKNLGEYSIQQSSQYPSYNLQKLVDETIEGSNHL